MSRNILLLKVICCLSLMTGACASGQGKSVVTATSLAAPTIEDSIPQREHRIGINDTLDIAVFEVPDLTRTLQVDGAGQITLPLIGNVPASGKTARELEIALAAALSRRYMQDPQVTVILKEAAQERITLDGEVREPGIYPIKGRTTLLQAVALGKGPTELADLRTVLIFRRIEGKRMAARYDLAQIRKGIAPDPEIFNNDTVVVDTSGSRSMLKSISAASPLAVFFTIF